MSSPGKTRDRRSPSSPSEDMNRLSYIATECISKAAHIILGGRILKTNKPASKCNRIFNLETEEVACSALETWKQKHLDTYPIIIEIYGTRTQEDSISSTSSEAILLEVWTLQLKRSGENSLSSSATSSGSSSGNMRLSRAHTSRFDTPLVYKRAVILLRSLFCFVRLLPTYSVSQVTKVSKQFLLGGGTVVLTLSKRSSSCKLSVTSEIRTGNSDRRGFIDSNYSVHEFNPIETPIGSICFSVSYVANPIDVLSRTLGNSVMYTPREQKGMSSNTREISTSSRGAYDSGGDSFAPHSAPQIARRTSWSFSRNQMELEATYNKSKFSDVMVVQGSQVEKARVLPNSSPMLIPGSRGKQMSRGCQSAPQRTRSPSASGSSSLSSQLRIKMNFSPSPSQDLPFAMTPKLNSGSSLSYDFGVDSGGIPSLKLVRHGGDSDSETSGSRARSFNGDSEMGSSPFALPFAESSPGPSELDAVGEFVLMLQEAPPLSTGTCRTVSSALLELKQMREALDTARLY